MRICAQVEVLLPVLCIVAWAAGGCAALRGGEMRRAGPVVVRRVTFEGWSDAVEMTNGEVDLVLVPQIARIMRFGPRGGENVLWVNKEFTGKGARVPKGEPGQSDWRNYGGYKLWPAPQKDWNWPPDWRLDGGPCDVEVTDRATVRLVGMPSPAAGLRFDREIIMAPTGARVDIIQTAVNISAKPVRTAIWDVTQVKADVVGFVPLWPGATYRTAEGGIPDDQWRMAGDMLLVSPAGRSGKLFFSGPPAWLGCKRGNLLYIKAFEPYEGAPPEPEAPRELFTGDTGYIELEMVGPATELQPGERTHLRETWHLIPVGPEAAADAGLISALKARAADLGLK